MTRLTNTIRETIRNKAVTAAMKERKEALAKAEHALGMEAYETVLPEKERKLAAQLSDRWFRLDSCLKFNAGGWAIYLTVTPGVPVPQSSGCGYLGALTGELAERVQAHSTAKKNLDNDFHKARSELDGFLAQFKSIKQMREAWPEGEPFYAEFDVERKAGGVPAVRVAEINKLLNLKAA